MNQSAFWKYYRDFNFYNIIFSLISGLIIFLTFGMLIGYLGFNYFRKDEYYLYYNLGWSKKHLLEKVFLMNLIFAGSLLLILAFFL